MRLRFKTPLLMILVLVSVEGCAVTRENGLNYFWSQAPNRWHHPLVRDAKSEEWREDPNTVVASLQWNATTIIPACCRSGKSRTLTLRLRNPWVGREYAVPSSEAELSDPHDPSGRVTVIEMDEKKLVLHLEIEFEEDPGTPIPKRLFGNYRYFGNEPRDWLRRPE